MEQGPEPKISLVEIIFIAPYLLVIDIIEICLLFFALDDFWIGDALAAPVAIWLWFRGVNATRYASMAVFELIPWVGDLPLLSIGFFMTVYLDRHPELEAVVQKTTGKVAAAKGGVLRQQRSAVSKPIRGTREGVAASATTEAREGVAAGPSAQEKREGVPTREGKFVGESEAGEAAQKKEAGMEETEIKVFGGKPEPLSKYETERIVSPPEMTDAQGPPRKESAGKNG